MVIRWQLPRGWSFRKGGKIRGLANTLRWVPSRLLSSVSYQTASQTHRHTDTDTQSDTQTHKHRHTNTDTQSDTWQSVLRVQAHSPSCLLLRLIGKATSRCNYREQPHNVFGACTRLQAPPPDLRTLWPG